MTAAAALRRDAGRRADLHVRPPARRPRRRARARLRPADARRCDGSPSARDDRYAPRAGRVVQRVLRAARCPPRSQTAARRGAASRRSASPQQRRVADPRHAAAGRLRPGGSRRLAAADGAASPRQSRRMGASATSGSSRTAAAPAARELLPARHGAHARPLHARRGARRHRTEPSISPMAIAGKTGTAEVAGAPSHSWFVGFAPYGPRATRRGCRGGHSRKRRIRRRRRGAGGRRNRRGRGSNRARPLTRSAASLSANWHR